MKALCHFVLPMLMVMFLTGCATGRMNWDAQVGVMTYGQAVNELGQPAQQKKLADGRTVVEWISRFPAASERMDNDFRYHAASFGQETAGADNYESKLRLTFGTNNVLAAWSKD